MELPLEIPTVMANAMRFFMLNGASVPEYQRNKIIALMGPGVSPVDFVVKTSEALYAVADLLDDDGREVAAQTANLAAMNGWHGMFERGQLMVNALRRMNGEEVPQPEDMDPPASTEYMEPVPVTDTPVPAPSIGPPV